MNPIDAYLVDEGEAPRQFPVFIRVADDHKGSLSDLIWDQNALCSAIEAAIVSGVPRSEILIVEYCAQEIQPGVFRKSSLYKIGDRFIPDIWWYGRSWDIKGDVDNLADTGLYESELAAMRENSFPARLKEAFCIAGGRLRPARLRDRR